MNENPRTNQQSRAAHLWFEQLATTLNDAGYERQLTIGTVDTPWSAWSVKTLFQKVAAYQFGKAHTSELTTKELSEVARTLERAIAEQGMEVPPFPSIEHLILQQQTNELHPHTH